MDDAAGAGRLAPRSRSKHEHVAAAGRLRLDEIPLLVDRYDAEAPRDRSEATALDRGPRAPHASARTSSPSHLCPVRGMPCMKTEGLSEAEINAKHAEKMRRKKEARDKIIATKTVEKGLLIVHTGKGKGKSTAAFGLVFRALGNGMRVGIVQFVKGKWETGERAALERFGDQVTMHTMGEGFTWETQDRARDIAAARAAWEKAKELIDGRSSMSWSCSTSSTSCCATTISISPRCCGAAEHAAGDEARRRHRPQRQGRADRGRRPRHRDGAGEAPVPLGREGATRHRVLGCVPRFRWRIDDAMTRSAVDPGDHGAGHRLACRQIADRRGALPRLCRSWTGGRAVQAAEHVEQCRCDGGWRRDRPRADAAGACRARRAVGPHESRAAEAGDRDRRAGHRAGQALGDAQRPRLRTPQAAS